MAAGKFKATCLAILDEVQAKREPVTVTKNGQPVAKLVPLDLADEKYPLYAFLFHGKIEIPGDIMAPLSSDEENEEYFERSCEQLK